jgi:hypothetical protein
VRSPWTFVILIGAFTCGCSDGIGNPILGEGLSAAGAGGTSGVAGTAGVSVSGGAGAGSGGVASGGAGGAGAPSAGTAGLGGGGRERPPPPGTGATPPWEEGFGGAGGDRMNLPPGGAPDPEECADVTSWEPEDDDAERELFGALNFARTRGEACGAPPGTEPPLDPAPPLAFNPALRCAARLHSRDMSQRAYFSHVTPEQMGPEDRMRQAGAVFRAASETIARSSAPPDQPVDPLAVLVDLFSAGGGECENLRDARFAWVGIGVYRGMITLDFAGP